MKRLIIFYILISFFHDSFAQVYIAAEGIYVKRYVKNDLKRPMFIYDGSPHYMDLYCKEYYFITKLDNHTICNRHDILDILCNCEKFVNTQYFLFPPFADTFLKYTEGVRVSQKPLPMGEQMKIKSKRYVYYAYQVKGHAIRICLNNDILNSNGQKYLDSLWCYSPPHINRAIPAYYTYLWTDYEISPVGVDAFSH